MLANKETEAVFYTASVFFISADDLGILTLT